MKLSITCFILAAITATLLYLSATAAGNHALYLPVVDTGTRMSSVSCPPDCEVQQ